MRLTALLTRFGLGLALAGCGGAGSQTTPPPPAQSVTAAPAVPAEAPSALASSPRAIISAAAKVPASAKPAASKPAASPAKVTGPGGLAVDAQGNVYVSDGDRVIRKLSPTGQAIARLGPSSGIEEFRPQAIAADAQGNLYAVDGGRNVVQKLASDGKPLASWKGTSGQQHTFRAVAVDRPGNVYVTDGTGAPVQKLSPALELTAEWGSKGVEAGQFSHPDMIEVDAQGNLYVGDVLEAKSPAGGIAARIQKLSPEGRPVSQWPGFELGYPLTSVALAVDSQGNVYAADSSLPKRVQRLSPEGKAMADLKVTLLPGVKPGASLAAEGLGFADVVALAVDAAGNVYADTGLDIRKLSPAGQELASWPKGV